MENASGRYYAFLDSDDIWDADYLEKMKKHIDENKDESVAIYYCGFRRKDSLCQKDIFPPYKNAGKKDFKRLLYYCTIFPSAAILDTQKLKTKVLFRENLRNLRDDYVFWLDVLRQGLTAVGYNDILVNRRHMDSQLTASKTNMVYPQWNVYRNVLKLNFMLSVFYMLTWTARGVFKHYILRKR
jgi:glycosyltransferase involved in cell wall biosynthesis